MAQDENKSGERSAAVSVVRRLRESGHEAYLAGGCVRDELLGLAPKDYDVATDARPERIGALFDRTREVGRAFAVMQVRSRGVWIEVATFRADGEYTDARRPDSIRFTDAREDALRRDFTINAMFLDPLADDAESHGAGVFGRVIDFVGGREDLEAGRIRAVGDPGRRLAEDHLRALRAVRFAARLGFEIDSGTARAIREHAASLSGVSRERIGDEVLAMLGHASRARAAETMQDLQLDGPVLNEANMVGELPALAAMADGTAAAYGLMAWALDRCGGDATAAGERVTRWREPLSLSNEVLERARSGLASVGAILGGWPGWAIAPQKRWASRPGWAEAVAALGARDRGRAEVVRARAVQLAGDGIGLRPAALIDGRDLQSLGLVPGPKFGLWLDQVYDMQLEGRVRTREQAIEVARSLADEKTS